MNINTNRLALALALSIFSYTATMMANDDPLIESVKEIFKGERVRLQQRGNEYEALVKEGDENLYSLTERYHQGIIFPLAVCEKYLDMLEEPLTEAKLVQLDHNLHHFLNSEKKGAFLEARYLQVILAATYIDRRQLNPEYLEMAKEFMRDKTSNEDTRNKAIIYFVEARMEEEFSKENPTHTPYWGIALKKAMDTYGMGKIDTNNIFESMLNAGISNLVEHCRLQAIEIDETNTALGWIIDWL